MGLFGNFNNNEDDAASKPDKTFQAMVELVGEKSPFGRYYTNICEILKARKVPASRFPSRAHFMSRMLASVDENKLNDWLVKYAEMEGINFKLEMTENETDDEDAEIIKT